MGILGKRRRVRNCIAHVRELAEGIRVHLGSQTQKGSDHHRTNWHSRLGFQIILFDFSLIIKKIKFTKNLKILQADTSPVAIAGAANPVE